VHEPFGSGPSGSWRINNFDLIRLLAALQVGIVHAITHMRLSGFFTHSVDFGLRLFPGVPIFFVVSGFLISKSYEHSGSLRDYCRNRCLRIFPGLWACLIVTVGVMLMAGVGVIGTISTRDWLLWWAAQMTVFQTYSPGFQWPPGAGTLNSSLWTIPVELEFYVLLPAIYALFRLRKRGGNIPLLAVFAASAALHFDLLYVYHRTPISTEYRYLLYTVVPYLWMFLVGVLMQRNWSTLRPVLAGRAHWWLLGYLSLCAVATRLGIGVGSNTITPVFLCPLAGLVISTATSAPGFADRILRHQDISYGTYAYHMLVINLMVGFGFVGSVFSVVSAIAITLLLATASWVLVEKPFLRHKHDALRRATG
jgi:peptidoglycan/LPS O-acetylase OafA/YrhL